jgi:N4-gp56 family major capsid protein
MALSQIGTSDPQAVKRWSPWMAREAINRTYARRFMGTDAGSIIQLHTDLKKERGDQIKYDLLVRLGGYGIHGSNTLKGNEQALTWYQDSFLIDQLREGVRYDTMTQQRTLHDYRAAAMDQLADFYARVFEEFLLASLCGTAGDNADLAAAVSFNGFTLTAPDAGHALDKTGAGQFLLSYVTTLKEMAVMMDPPIRPARFDGRDWFVLLLHPYQITSLKEGTGVDAWRSFVAQAANRGEENPLFNGAVGMWDGVVIHESTYLPRIAASNTNYGLLLGAQAGHIGFGNPYSKLGRQVESSRDLFSIVEDVDDYGELTGVGVASIFGVKKARFNSKDYGLIRVATIDAPSS